MLDNRLGYIRQEIPTCLRSGKFRDGAGVPRPFPLRWAYADQTAGGQNHSPTVRNTINSEPTNIDRQESPTGSARIWRSRWGFARPGYLDSDRQEIGWGIAQGQYLSYSDE